MKPQSRLKVLALCMSLIGGSASVSDAAAASLTPEQAAALTTGPDVFPDDLNKGYFYLKYPPNARNAPFAIMYIASTSFLGISLLKKPLRKSRMEAETYLMRKLKLSPSQMCSLSYQLTTPNSVSSSYAGEDLWFSFCPNAVRFR
jgi:hypothetical protein